MNQIKHRLLSLLYAGMILSSLFAYANIPETSPIPKGLSDIQNKKITHSKMLLQNRWKTLVSKVESHNQQCQNIPSGTQRAFNCRQKMDQLQNEIASYVTDVRQFNNTVATLIQKIKSTIVSKEQNDYDKKNKQWLIKQQDLIRQAVTSEQKVDKKILLDIHQNKVPNLPQKTLNHLKSGDVILLRQDNSVISSTIPYGDVLSRWVQTKSLKSKKYDISHSVVYLKSIKGKRLYLDHQFGDKFARIIDEDTFLKRYEKRLSYVARPKALINGKKLWEAAKGVAIKDNTPYGVFGENVVCSEIDTFAVVQATGKKLSFLKNERWGPINMTPSDFIDPETKGRYFIISSLKK